MLEGASSLPLNSPSPSFNDDTESSVSRGRRYKRKGSGGLASMSSFRSTKPHIKNNVAESVVSKPLGIIITGKNDPKHEEEGQKQKRTQKEEKEKNPKDGQHFSPPISDNKKETKYEQTHSTYKEEVSGQSSTHQRQQRQHQPTASGQTPATKLSPLHPKQTPGTAIAGRHTHREQPANKTDDQRRRSRSRRYTNDLNSKNITGRRLSSSSQPPPPLSRFAMENVDEPLPLGYYPHEMRSFRHIDQMVARGSYMVDAECVSMVQSSLYNPSSADGANPWYNPHDADYGHQFEDHDARQGCERNWMWLFISIVMIGILIAIVVPIVSPPVVLAEQNGGDDLCTRVNITALGEQADIELQCRCLGYIQALPPTVIENYRLLSEQILKLTYIAPTLAPTTNSTTAVMVKREATPNRFNISQCASLESRALLDFVMGNLTDLQRYAASVLFGSLNVPKSQKLLNNTTFIGDSVCDWDGIQCQDGQIKSLELTKYDLDGSLPAELGLLTDLEIINLAESGFIAGTIPTQIGLLNKLAFLSLAGSNLSGTIPSEIGAISSLEYFSLASAGSITGSLPREIGNLHRLVFLNVQNNTLNTSIPVELANLTALEYLSLKQNTFSGQIPTELGRLSLLSQLFISFNNFTDSNLPSFLWDFKNLRKLDVSHLRLNGISPIEGLAELSDLEVLQLSDSKKLPTEIGLLTNLVDLRCHNNHIQGSMPSEIGFLTKLTALSLAVNELTGSIPTDLNRLTKLVALDLSNNSLVGDLETLCGIIEHDVVFSSMHQRDQDKKADIICSCCGS